MMIINGLKDFYQKDLVKGISEERRKEAATCTARYAKSKLREYLSGKLGTMTSVETTLIGMLGGIIEDKEILELIIKVLEKQECQK